MTRWRSAFSSPDVQVKSDGTMRVLHVIGAVDPEFGGTSEVSVNMCIAAQRKNVRTTLAFAFAASAEESIQAIEDRLAREGVTVRRFPTVPIFQFHARRWGMSIQLFRWIMRHAGRFDIVHIHQVWGLAQVAALVVVTLSRRPCVITPHESLTDYDVDREKRLIKSLLKRWYLRSASSMWITSPLEAIDTIPPRHISKSRVVPYPLPSSRATPRSQRPRNPRQPLVAGFLGRLHPKKNVDLIVRSVARGPAGTRLRVAGSGPEAFERTLVKGAAECGVADRVEWLGFVTRNERPAFLDSLDVLLLVSEYESFGLAIAEGMARGVPVIVSSRTGIASIVAKYDCGLVVEPNPTEVAAALLLLADDTQRAARMGAQGLIAVRDELTMDAYGTRARLGYEDLVSVRR